MDDDVVRIMISTDSHLGHLEKDPVRCDDSFAAFEEHADMVLLAGDVFHENKPSRRTLHSAMDILAKYSYGDSPIFLEILNDQCEVFHSRNKRANYEDPFQSISLPVFSIHGNHDDPTREGGHSSLAAMDLLSVTNLVNYFGKSNEVDNIEITPILFRKRDTCIALYGLGAVRDERLNRMWNQKRVRFVRPSEDQGQGSYFNIFVLHQNRDYGRGSKNCIHESMIPDWMDVVVWGNEHECQPRLCESMVGTFRIYQPGSSVPTSLVDGESLSNPKHMGLLEVRGKQFRLNTTRFVQNRSFVFSEVSLGSSGLDPQDPKVEEKATRFLAERVELMVQEARAAHADAQPLAEPTLFSVRSPELVLVRLKVDHIGFPAINTNRFGALFVGKVANPSETLLLSKRRKEVRVVDGRHDGESVRGFLEENVEDDLNKVKIDDLVKESLRNSKKPLGLLVEATLMQALDDFIFKKSAGAIEELVEDTLEETRRALYEESGLDSKDRIVESAGRYKRATEESIGKGERVLVAREAKAGEKDDFDLGDGGNSGDSDAPRVAESAKSKAKAAPKKAASQAPKAAAKRAPSKAKGKGALVDDEEEAIKPAPKRAPRAAASSKKKYVEEEAEEEAEEESAVSEDGIEDEDSEEEFKRPVGKGRGRSPAPAPKKKPAAARALPMAGKAQGRSAPITIDDDDDDDEPKGMYSNRSLVSEASIKLPPSQPAQKKRSLPLNMSSQSSASNKKTLTSQWE